MGKGSEAERVRLTVPADAAMVEVVGAAVRSLSALARVTGAEAEAFREDVRGAFLAQATGGDPIVLEALVADGRLEVEVVGRDRVALACGSPAD